MATKSNVTVVDPEPTNSSKQDGKGAGPNTRGSTWKRKTREAKSLHPFVTGRLPGARKRRGDSSLLEDLGTSCKKQK